MIFGTFWRDIILQFLGHIKVTLWNNRGFDLFQDPPDYRPVTSYSTLDNRSREMTHRTPAKGLPRVIRGWQRLGSQEGRINPNPQTRRRNVTVYTDNSIWEPGDKFKAPFAQIEVALSEFHLEESTKYEDGALPYNSTLWYDGAVIKLDAPFLRFRGCPWWRTPLGECLCYKGEPLIADFRIKGNEACMGKSEYIWGFSYFITTVGIILELAWCLVCLYLWVHSKRGSSVAKYDRSALGTMRNILDISEVLHEELGDNLSWQSEKDLKVALKGHPEVGYATTEKSPGVFHIKLVSFPGGRPLQRQP